MYAHLYGCVNKNSDVLLQYGIHLETFVKDDIDYGEELGRGGEGIVHRCTVMYHGLPIEAAAKRVLKNTIDAISITLDEIELLWYVTLTSLL